MQEAFRVLPVPKPADASRLHFRTHITAGLLFREFLEGDHCQLAARQGFGVELEFPRFVFGLPIDNDFQNAVQLCAGWSCAHDLAFREPNRFMYPGTVLCLFGFGNAG